MKIFFLLLKARVKHHLNVIYEERWMGQWFRSTQVNRAELRTCVYVRVLSSKSQCGCLPIIMMLLNPLALKLTLLSSLTSSLLYTPPFLHTF